MKYVVLTTKHHEGFCLWDSALTDYKATNTPAGRDLVRAVRRRVPRRGPQDRLLPLADRLAPPRLPDRRRCTRSATTPSCRERDAGRDMRELRRVPARPGARAADRLRRDRRTCCSTSPTPARDLRAAAARATTTGAPRRWSQLVRGAAAGHPDQRPPRHPRRPRSRPEQYQPAEPTRASTAEPVAVGGLPDAQRQLGLRPRQPGLEVAGPAGADAGRRGHQGRQPAAQRRPDRARRVRPAGPAQTLAGDRRLDAPARPLDLRRRAAATSRRRRTAATPSAATGSTCTCSPGRSSTCTCPGSPAGSSTPSC